MATATRDQETLKRALQEAHEQYARFERAARALDEAEGPDALDEAEATLAVEAHWLELKASAVAKLLDDDERDGEATR